MVTFAYAHHTCAKHDRAINCIMATFEKCIAFPATCSARFVQRTGTGGTPMLWATSFEIGNPNVPNFWRPVSQRCLLQHQCFPVPTLPTVLHHSLRYLLLWPQYSVVVMRFIGFVLSKLTLHVLMIWMGKSGKLVSISMNKTWDYPDYPFEYPLKQNVGESWVSFA